MNFGGFLAHEFQMTVRHHDFIFQASVIVITDFTDNILCWAKDSDSILPTAPAHFAPVIGNRR